MQISRIVVLFALRREAHFLYQSCRNLKKIEGPIRGFSFPVESGSMIVEILEGGMGQFAMEETLNWLNARPNSPPSLIVSAGYCGALNPDLSTGSVVTVNEVIDEAGNQYRMIHPDGFRLLTASRLIGTKKEKKLLGEKYQASAVDMESAVIARWCQRKMIDMACIKGVSDDFQTEISPQVLQLLSSGKIAYFQLVWNILVCPSLLFDLFRLAKNTREAGRNLAQAIHAVIDSFQLNGWKSDSHSL